MKKALLMSFIIGLTGSCAALANQIHIIVKNNFQDANSTVQVSKFADLTDINVVSDTLTDNKLSPNTVGKSVGEMIISSDASTEFTKTVAIKTSQGDCNIDFAYKNGNFTYASQSGAACDYATTILKTNKMGYFLIVDFSSNQEY